MKRSRIATLITFCILSLLVSAQNLKIVRAVISVTPTSDIVTETNWPQWRGPNGQGISGENDLPTEWSETKNVQWKTAIPGRGHSSPIVWGKRIFLTTSIEGEVNPSPNPPKHYAGSEVFEHPDWTGVDHKYKLNVLAIDSETGKIIWEKTAYDGAVSDYRHRNNTYASPTPVTDGKYVYAFFGTEGLYCYDFNGTLVWKVSLGVFGTEGMGVGTSPVLFENLLILTCDHEFDGKGSYIIALDRMTGKEVWKTPRNNRATWATPVLIKTPERTQLVVSGAESVVSYDPATGQQIWRCSGVISHAIPSPVVGNSIVVLSAGSQAKKAFAVKLGAKGDLTGSSNILWTYQKGTAYVPSPIMYGDYVYLLSDSGIITCIDARTGDVKYEGGRVPIPTKFFASPVAYAGNILLSGEDGDCFLIKAGPKHEVIRTNSLGEPIHASPAIANGRIYIRGEHSLYCIANKKTS